MKILFTKAKWERFEQELEPFLADTKAAGFDATEIYTPSVRESPSECIRLHESVGLKLVAQIITEGATPAEHMRVLEERFLRAVECGPILVNCHTGRDIWPMDDNLRIFDRALELEARHGIPFCHETHRSRPLFSGPSTAALLEARPALKLTADFSHWMCVHETDLADQPGALAAAVQASHHVHARVGHSQGPEVPDPRVAEWRPWLERSLEIWRRIVAARRASGAGFLTIAPEFGPPPYMPTLPATGEPLADAWEINCWMRQFLKGAIPDPDSK
jgi:sugar phosphate isomerase/epimerase